MPFRPDWLPEQLTEFLAAVSSYVDEQAACDGAVERAAEAIEAEVGVLLRDGVVVSSVGFPQGEVPDEVLRALVDDRRRWLSIPGVGVCAVISVPFDDDPPGHLIVARSGEDFTHGEISLLRGMGRVLALVRRTLRVLDSERESRKRSEEHATENAHLLAGLQARQSLLERLFEIQRSISHRAPTQQVLDAITSGVAKLLEADVAVLRLLDGAPGGGSRVATSVGTLADGAVGERAMAEGLLVKGTGGDQALMAAPVHRDGQVAGSLVVGSSDRARQWTASEQEVLLSFAEHASLTLNDASAVEQMQRAVDDAIRQAHHDSLTGLPNRTLVLERLSHALVRARRNDARVAVLFVDLDRFKLVNDSLGHSIGDEVLVEVADRLRASVREGDTVARLAGDEFVVLCEDVDGLEVLHVAERVAQAVAQPIPLYGRDTVITASIGIAYADPSSQAEDVLRDSDVAMYRAKERGRARIELFDRLMRKQTLERIEIEHALRRAMREDELRLHYQPIFSADPLELVAVEALVRWQHPDRGLVAPDEFIPIAEETGLIIPLGRWVLHQACSQLAAWRASDPGLANLRVSVNLSAREFADPGLIGVVSEAVRSADIPPDALCLEITESVLMEEAEATVDTLQVLKSFGVHLAMDDFGTGYSSLSYLKRFPVDQLKIDRSFVDGLGTDPEDEAIVTAVVRLAQALSLHVLAEGVETEVQLAELRRLGCNSVQGHLLGRPHPPAGLVEVLSAGTPV
jgi:diguanylate cyclase (GGDEF)-like protein